MRQVFVKSAIDTCFSFNPDLLIQAVAKVNQLKDLRCNYAAILANKVDDRLLHLIQVVLVKFRQWRGSLLLLHFGFYSNYNVKWVFAVD